MFILKHSTEKGCLLLKVAEYQRGDSLLFLYLKTKYNKAEKKNINSFNVNNYLIRY